MMRPLYSIASTDPLSKNGSKLSASSLADRLVLEVGGEDCLNVPDLDRTENLFPKKTWSDKRVEAYNPESRHDDVVEYVLACSASIHDPAAKRYGPW